MRLWLKKGNRKLKRVLKTKINYDDLKYYETTSKN